MAATRDPSALDEVGAWLESLLADGPLPSREIFRLAKEEGGAVSTVKRAKAKVGLTVPKGRLCRGLDLVLDIDLRGRARRLGQLTPKKLTRLEKAHTEM